MLNTDKAAQRINELEREIVHIFEQTGLVSRARFCGELTSTEFPLYLEYRLKEKHDGVNPEVAVRAIMVCIASRLTQNHSEVLALEAGHDKHSGAKKEYVRVCPEAEIGDGLDLRYQILQCMKREIINYHMKK